MITFSPSPQWKDLLKLLIPAKVDFEKLIQYWERPGDQAFWFSRTAWSLYAIVLWWKKTFTREKSFVWIPGYFCNQSLWPIRQSSANIIFYPVKEGLLPDWEACAELALTHKPDIFVLTHYYGMVSESKSAKLFCENNNALFVEDAAHFLVPVPGVGESSHIVLYSPHKVFAIPHGAICVFRPMLEKYVTMMGGKKIDIEEIRDEIGDQSPPYFMWLINRLIQKLTANRLADFKKTIPYEEDGTSFPMEKTPQMHKMAKKLLSFLVQKIPDYIKHRQQCVLVWDYLLAQNNLPVERIVSNSHDIPYLGVYNALNHVEASDLYYRLTAKKWPVSSWPDLPPEVRQNPDLFSKTIYFRNNMLVLPAHQSLNFFELVRRYGLGGKEAHDFRLVPMGRSEWEFYFSQIAYSTLLQSWAYGEAKEVIEGWLPTRFLIQQNDKPVALLQVLQKRIGPLTLVRVNRGPLWLMKEDRIENLRAVFQLIRKHFPLKKAYLLLFSPNLEDTTQSQLLLFQSGYWKLPQKKVGTVWLNLRQSQEALRAAMRSNWRRQLGGAERNNLQFHILNLRDGVDWLLKKNTEFQNQKAFTSIPPAMIQYLVSLSGKDKCFECFLFQATYERIPVAGMLMVKHGLACTYLLVWTGGEEGRHLHATNFLLWHAILTMKENNCVAMDLGGISESTPSLSAIASFKRGLGGNESWFIGECISV